jgi:hypothetical protein
VPECPALAFDRADLTAFFATRSRASTSLACVAFDLPRLEVGVTERTPPRTL